jgi:hypothetical protein
MALKLMAVPQRSHANMQPMSAREICGGKSSTYQYCLRPVQWPQERSICFLLTTFCSSVLCFAFIHFASRWLLLIFQFSNTISLSLFVQVWRQMEHFYSKRRKQVATDSIFQLYFFFPMLCKLNEIRGVQVLNMTKVHFHHNRLNSNMLTVKATQA